MNRCKNCGWPNRPGEDYCVKCGSPLVGEEQGPLRATVLEPSNSYGDNICPKCGNPLPADAENCPNCNYYVSSQQQVANNYSPQSNNANIQATRLDSPTRMDNPATKKSKISGTQNPYMIGPEAEPTIVLTPQKRLNEKNNPTGLEYEGKSVVLNRSNTEPDNQSITSQTQAVISNIDGRWFIEDKSEQGTTFVRATRNIELKDGDMILLGNRLFEFRVSND